MQQKKSQGIYIELDALLDTRLATIHEISLTAEVGTAFTEQVLEAGYYDRDEDVFPHLDRDTFKEIYRTRDQETLTHAMPTKWLSIIKGLVAALVKNAMMHPTGVDIFVMVNTYPYTLTDEFKTGLIDLVYSSVGSMVDVSLIDIPSKDLKPTYCRNTFSQMIMYSCDEWLTLHMPELEKIKPKELTLTIPAIYFVGKPTKEKLLQMTEGKTSPHFEPFKSVEILLGLLLDVQILDPKLYCLDPDNLQKVVVKTDESVTEKEA